MEKPHPYPDTANPTPHETIDFCANAVVELRARLGEQQHYTGETYPVNERRFIIGLIQLYMGRRAPDEQGRNPYPVTLPGLIQSIYTVAYNVQQREARNK